MDIFIKGRAFDFLALMVVSLAMAYFVWKTRQTKKPPFIRILPGIEALPEAVGRAVETGRPVHYTEGHPLGGKIYDVVVGPMYLAGLSIMGYVASLCAQKGAKLVCSIGHAEILPIITESIRTQYLLAGKLEDFNEGDIYYFPEQSYTLGTMEMIEGYGPTGKKAAANLLFGNYWGQDTIMLPEAGVYAGSIGIGGSANTGTVCFFVASLDYCLIGEELFVAGAIASGNPDQLASIAGQDVAKVFGIVIAIINVLLISAGILWFNTLIKM